MLANRAARHLVRGWAKPAVHTTAANHKGALNKHHKLNRVTSHHSLEHPQGGGMKAGMLQARYARRCARRARCITATATSSTLSSTSNRHQTSSAAITTAGREAHRCDADASVALASSASSAVMVLSFWRASARMVTSSRNRLS